MVRPPIGALLLGFMALLTGIVDLIQGLRFLGVVVLGPGQLGSGLPREVAEKLAFQTLLGAAQLLAAGEAGPAELRAAVTSPGGTTAAGLRELERHGVRSAFLDAVTAASDRSRELGG